MDVQQLFTLVLNRLRSDLTDPRQGKKRKPEQWILSRFPTSDDAETLEEFASKHGYPIVIVKTPQLTGVRREYLQGSHVEDYTIKFIILHAGALAQHDALVSTLTSYLKDLDQEFFFEELDFSWNGLDFSPPTDEIYSGQDKNYVSTLSLNLVYDSD